MTLPTHVSFAYLSWVTVLNLAGLPFRISVGAVLLLASLLPDIDNPKSFFGRLFPTFSAAINRRWGHRGLFHSMTLLFILAAAASPLIFFNIHLYLALLFGYASHIVLDTSNINGVQATYPFSQKRWCFPFIATNPTAYRIVVGSKAERNFMFIVISLGLLFTPMALLTPSKVIRWFMKDIRSAVGDFNELSSTNSLQASIQGVTFLEKKPVSGTFPLVGVLSDNTVLIEINNVLYSFGEKFNDNIASTSIRVHKGNVHSLFTNDLDMAGKRLSFLSSLKHPKAQTYLFGEITMVDAPAFPVYSTHYNPVEASGKVLMLRYARPDDIYALGLSHYQCASGIVTVKSYVPEGANFSVDMAALEAMNTHSYQFYCLDTSGLNLYNGLKVSPGQFLAADDSILNVLKTLRNELTVMQKKGSSFDQDTRQQLAEARAALIKNDADLARISGEIKSTRSLIAKGLSYPSVLDNLNSRKQQLDEQHSSLVSKISFLSGSGSASSSEAYYKASTIEARIAGYDRKAKVIANISGSINNFSAFRDENYYFVSFIIVPDSLIVKGAVNVRK